MPWSITEHARALLNQADLPHGVAFTLQTITGEARVPLKDTSELVWVFRAVSDTPVIHRLGGDGFTVCAAPLSYSSRNALLPYKHARMFAVDCPGGCFE